jgi:hypothetical protein
MASTQIEKADPVVLGVSVPLTVTVEAAKQVSAAWKEFGTGLVAALAQARESTKGTIKSKTKAATKAAAAELDVAAAAAGVNA